MAFKGKLDVQLSRPVQYARDMEPCDLPWSLALSVTCTHCDAIVVVGREKSNVCTSIDAGPEAYHYNRTLILSSFSQNICARHPPLPAAAVV